MNSDLSLGKHAYERMRERMPSWRSKTAFKNHLRSMIAEGNLSAEKPAWFDDRLNMHQPGRSFYLYLNAERTQAAVMVKNLNGSLHCITVLFDGYVWEATG